VFDKMSVKDLGALRTSLDPVTGNGVGAGVADVAKFLEAHVQGEWSSAWHGKVKSKGWMSVTAAVTAVTRNDSMSKLLKYCINYGGDVDTVASIALAAASNSREVEQDLPQHLIVTLENGEYGQEYIETLDRRLMERVKR